MLFVGLGSITAANTNLLTNEDNVFVVGFNSEFPPFGYKDDDGNYTGFDIELAKEVAKRNNWTFVPEPLPSWDTKDTELNSEIVECIWSELTINGRENDYTWSKPYFNNSQVVVVKSDSGINSLNDLKDKTVEVQEGQSVLNNLESDKKAVADSFKSLVKIKDYNTGFMDLESGACDALIVDMGLAKYLLKEKGASGQYKILDEPLAYEVYGIGFKKGNEELRNQVQDTLDEMYADGTVDKIAQKYSNYGITDGLLRP
jgi:polar amino acid transport system substrate-binding protein